MTSELSTNAPTIMPSHGFASAALSQATGPSEFRPVTGADEMQSGGRLLVEAYAAIWLVLLALVLFMWRRTRALEDRIAVLDEAVRKSDVAAKVASKPKKRPESKVQTSSATGSEDD